jgi:hypothetical protein
MNSLKDLPWTDQSTADPVEKARRVLRGFISPDATHFFDDGFPKHRAMEANAKCVLAVVDDLARDAAMFRALVASVDRLEGKKFDDQNQPTELRIFVKTSSTTNDALRRKIRSLIAGYSSHLGVV